MHEHSYGDDHRISDPQGDDPDRPEWWIRDEHTIGWSPDDGLYHTVSLRHGVELFTALTDNLDTAIGALIGPPFP